MIELEPREADLLVRVIEALHDSPHDPWSSCIAVVLPDEGGFIQGVDCAPVDITDARDIEALLTKGLVNCSAASHTIRVVDVTALGFAWYDSQQVAVAGHGDSRRRSDGA